MSAHTPGPWIVHDSTDSYGWRNYSINYGREDGNSDANARLIAAAPELLDALYRVHVFLRNGIELGFIWMPDAETNDPASSVPEIVRAAIAKAEGR